MEHGVCPVDDDDDDECLFLIVSFQEVGYQHGKTVFNVWGRSGVLDKMLKDRQEICKSKTSGVSVQFKSTLLIT